MPLGADSAPVDLVAGSDKSRILLQIFFRLILTVVSHLLLPAPAPVLPGPMARIGTECRERSFVEIPAFHQSAFLCSLVSSVTFCGIVLLLVT